MSELYIGLMSGTSIDGIDAAIVDLSSRAKLICHHSHNIPEKLKISITQLSDPDISTLYSHKSSVSYDKLDLMGEIDTQLGILFADAVIALLEKSGINKKQIKAIGSHGQTIRHRPPVNSSNNPDSIEPGFSLQIGDPNTIAARTGITTVADFRRKDMAYFGQGAPFAPIFHQVIAPEGIETCAFLNLGGIANLTVIHQNKLVSGFDTGPANGLMDAWINARRGLPYDESGDWANSGKANTSLLNELLKEPFFQQLPPKSTGKETFNLEWLKRKASKYDLSDTDIQATLLQLTARSISNSIKALEKKPSKIFCCGGGINNTRLMEALKRENASCNFESTNELGIHPDWIEAATFAWLAKQRIENSAIDLGDITGATKNCLLGGVYQNSCL